MRLSTKGRYAVMAMADLAKNGSGRAVSLAEIATRQEISLSYLEQLFARLRKGGLVKSIRGPGGGYRLAKGPALRRPRHAARMHDGRCALHHPRSLGRSGRRDPSLSRRGQPGRCD